MNNETIRTCSDERPCINCYADQGECLGPEPETVRQRDAATLKAAQGGVTEAGYVFVCSNHACRAVHIRDPRGFCPACVAENGSGWSTTRQRLYRDGPERYSTEEEGEAFMDGWYDGQAALSAEPAPAAHIASRGEELADRLFTTIKESVFPSEPAAQGEVFPTACMPPEQEEMKAASMAIGSWLAAALDDPSVCDEMKRDINRWFDAAMPSAPPAQPAVPEIHISCETESNGIKGSTSLRVIRVNPEDDGSFTAVTDHWPQPAERVPDDYAQIARLIGRIFFYGDFQAETYNERELERLLRKTGNFYETEERLLAAPPAAPAEEGDGKEGVR